MAITRADIANALHLNESGGRPTSVASVDGARGGMQIIPETFAAFADPGMDINNPTHNFTVAARYINHLAAKSGDDPIRIAVGYFSGEGNIAPPNSPTPWIKDRVDGNGTRVSQYVAKFLNNLAKVSESSTLAGGSAEDRLMTAPKKLTPLGGGAGPSMPESAPLAQGAVKLTPLGGTASSSVPTAEGLEASTEQAPASTDQTTLYERFGTGTADKVHGLNQRIYALLQEFVPTLKDPRLSRQALWGDPKNELEKQTDAFQNAPSPVEGIGDSYAQKLKAREANYQARRGENANTFDPTRMVGNITIEAPTAAMPGANTLKGAALLGALSSSLNPDAPSTSTMVGDFGPLGNTVGTLSGGAIAGLSGKKLSDFAGSVIGGFKPTDEAALLRSKGIPVTPPQALGGQVQQIENLLRVLPIFGEAQQVAKNRGRDALNRMAMNEALTPIREKSTAKLGRPMIDEAQKKISGFYDNLLPRLTFTPDAEYNTGIQTIRANLNSLPTSLQKTFDTLITTYLDAPLNTSGSGTMTGPELNSALKYLGRKASKYLKSTGSTAEKELGEALGQVNELLLETMERANPEDAADLRAVRQAWANFRVVRRASKAADQGLGEFDPIHLQRAVKGEDTTADDWAYTQGAARLQPMADAAVSTLGSEPIGQKVGSRYLWTGLLGSLGTAAIAPEAVPFVVGGTAGLGLGALGYSRPTQAAFNAMLFDRPKVLSQVGQGLKDIAPVGALTGSNVLSNYSR